MAIPRPSYLSERQWRQVRWMRFGIWFLTVQAALAGVGSAGYIATVMITDRRRRLVRMSPPVPHR